MVEWSALPMVTPEGLGGRSKGSCGLSLPFVMPRKKQAYGARAKNAMSELVFGKDIDLWRHAIDRYGRTVAQVGVDGKDVGLEMIRQGMAWVSERYTTEASAEIQET